MLCAPNIRTSRQQRSKRPTERTTNRPSIDKNKRRDKIFNEQEYYYHALPYYLEVKFVRFATPTPCTHTLTLSLSQLIKRQKFQSILVNATV